MNVEKIKAVLSAPKKIVITTHHKPDGDAVGSSLGLYNYLKQKGHQVTVVVPNDYPEFLQWMPGNAEVVDFEKTIPKATQIIAEAEVIFCLDFNKLFRCEKVAPEVEKSTAIKVLIDHHLFPDEFCTYQYAVTTACATAEIIYQFIDALGDASLVNKDVAECLYTGIMTDTASFRFASTKPETHRIVAALMETGMENHKIHERVYDCWSEGRIRLLGYCLKEKMQVLPEFNAAVMGLTKKELNMFHHKTGDTEGLVNIPLSIKNIRLSAFFVERGNEVKISFRSKDDFDARALSSEHFEGGGHKGAAGGRSSLPLQEAIAKFISILPQYKEELTK